MTQKDTMHSFVTLMHKFFRFLSVQFESICEIFVAVPSACAGETTTAKSPMRGSAKEAKCSVDSKRNTLAARQPQQDLAAFGNVRVKDFCRLEVFRIFLGVLSL